MQVLEDYLFSCFEFKFLKGYANRPRDVIVNFKPNEKNVPLEPLPKNLPLPREYTYERTPAYKRTPTEHQELRCQAAINKRGTELAYSKFLARTSSEPFNYFGNDNNQKRFLLALDPIELTIPIYMSALNPTDQIFDFDELEYYYQLRFSKEVSYDEQNYRYRSQSECETIQFNVSPQRRNSDEVSVGPLISESSSTSDLSSKRTVVNSFLKFIK